MAANLRPRSPHTWHVVRRRTVISASVLASSLCSGFVSQAQDIPKSDGIIGPAVRWSLESDVSLRLDGDINRPLDAGVHETGLTVDLDGGFTLGAETKRSDASLDFGVSRTFFWGEDQSSNNDAERLDPRLSLEGSYRSKTYTISANAGFEFKPTSFTQDEDTGIIDDETTQLTIKYGADLTLELDRSNQLVFSTDAQIVDFSDPTPDLNETRTFGANLAWQRQVTETTTLTFTGGGRYFTAQNAEDTKSTTVDISVALEHQRTRRHTFGLTAGVTAVRNNRVTPLGIRESDLMLGATGSVSFEYVLKDLDIGINLTQNIDPSATGALQSFSRVNSNLNYDVNEQEQLGLRANFFHRAPLSGDAGSTLNSLTIGPTYSLTLVEGTQLSVGYLFRMNQDSITGTATGHRLFLTLTQDFDILP